MIFSFTPILLIISHSVQADKSFPTHHRPLQVSFRLFVNTVSPIISADMEFKISIRLVLEWEDPRVAEEFECNNSTDFPITLSAQKIKDIWVPDLFFLNSRSAATKSFVNPLVHLKLMAGGNGPLQLTMIANATVACNMDFHFYPMDVQHCPLLIQSFKYSSDELLFNWASDVPHPFVVNPQRLIQFQVVLSPPPYATSIWFPNQGNFSLLVAVFQFERLVGSYLVQTFIPSGLVVTLSWCSFWLELEVTAARGFLLVTSILTLVTYLSGLKAELPPVAYVKTFDVWIFGCMLSIFFAFAEFILVKVIYSITEEQRSTNLVQELTLTVKKEPLNPQKNRLGSVVLSGRSVATEHMPVMHLPISSLVTLPLVWNSRDGKKVILWRKLDQVSRWLFPLTFGIFCLSYWAILISHYYTIVLTT